MKFFSNFKNKFFGDEIRISFSGKIDALINCQKIFCCFHDFFKNGSDKKNIIDLTSVEFAYPSTLFILIALRETMIDRGLSFEVVIEEASTLHEYLDYAGFCDLFDIPSFPENKKKSLKKIENIFKIESGEKMASSSQKAMELVDFLKKRQSMSSQVEAEMVSSIDEILRNILQHSECKSFYLIAQSYSSTNKVRFVFYDNGIGIKRHMTRLPYEETHTTFQRQVSKQDFEKILKNSADEAILYASKYGVSATNYEDNSGAGLNFLIEDMSSVANGKILICSENGVLLWEDGKESPSLRFPLPYVMKGTIVALELSCNLDTEIIYENEV